MSDGTFWVGEENAPSLAHFAADGQHDGAPRPGRAPKATSPARPTDTIGSLPAIVAKRQGNRGIEGIAVSPDERFLYFIMQNPLANPDSAAFSPGPQHAAVQDRTRDHASRRRIRLQLDDPQSFRRDPSRRQSDPRISELMAIGLDRLIVLERTEQTTKLYEVELAGATNIAGTPLGRCGDAADARAERRSAVGIVPLTKTLRLDTADHPTIVGKTEGMTLLGDGALALINDDDFGITGAARRSWSSAAPRSQAAAMPTGTSRG